MVPGTCVVYSDNPSNLRVNHDDGHDEWGGALLSGDVLLVVTILHDLDGGPDGPDLFVIGPTGCGWVFEGLVLPLAVL